MKIETRYKPGDSVHVVENVISVSGLFQVRECRIDRIVISEDMIILYGLRGWSKPRSADELYDTEADAQAECDRRNAEAKS